MSMPAEHMMQDAVCAECHGDIARQAGMSMHRFSSFNNPAYRFSVDEARAVLLERDGFLVSCSCSHHLSSADLLAALQRAARHVDRFVQVLEIGGQSADHPQHPALTETGYLKALAFRLLP